MKRIIVPVLGLLLLVAAGGCSIRTAGAPKGDLTLQAVFDDVQGLVVGHGVQVSDVPVGTVTRIRLEGFRARVTMSIQNGRRIPVGTTAGIARTSLLGENYVRLNPPPGRDLTSGPALADNATIDRTSVQPDLELVSEKAAPLLAALGGQELGQLVDAGAKALGDQGPTANKLIAQMTQITTRYAASTQDLGVLLDGMARLGDNLAKGAGELDRLPGSLNTAAQRLLEDRHRLKQSIREATRLAETFNTLVHSRHGARVKAMLAKAKAIIDAILRGRQELKTFARRLLDGFVAAPSASYGGQGLQFVWLAGLFDPGEGGHAKDQRTQAGGRGSRPPGGIDDLNRLLVPLS